MNFYQKRLEKTLAYILFKLNIASNMTNALELIQQGKVQINNRKVNAPNYICSGKDVVSVMTQNGVNKIKLTEYFKV